MYVNMLIIIIIFHPGNMDCFRRINRYMKNYWRKK